ncbi:MAG: 50S ribosomal protein L34 [Phycisphaerae bacterium]|nr:50S ribosomal protein L34 [Phycisphaerae bacterium]
MHYPRKLSKIKRLRKQGFRARMRTTRGRKLVNRQRRRGRHAVSITA